MIDQDLLLLCLALSSIYIKSGLQFSVLDIESESNHKFLTPYNILRIFVLKSCFFFSFLYIIHPDKLDGKEDTSPTSPHSTYLQTDLDSGEQVDLAQASSHFTSSNKSYDSHAYDGEASDALIMDEALSRPVINHQRQVGYPS